MAKRTISDSAKLAKLGTQVQKDITFYEDLLKEAYEELSNLQAALSVKQQKVTEYDDILICLRRLHSIYKG